METQLETSPPFFVYHRIATKVSRQDFNRYIDPHLKRPTPGPKPKLSLYKIFNDIRYVLPTGRQGHHLKTKRNELHYPNVYKWPKRWATNGTYQALFAAAIIHRHHTEQLDPSVLHGDGSNTVVQKGAQASDTPAIHTRKVKKH